MIPGQKNTANTDAVHWMEKTFLREERCMLAARERQQL